MDDVRRQTGLQRGSRAVNTESDREAIDLIHRYRRMLLELLGQEEGLERAVATLLDRLTLDLMAFYNRAENGSSSALERNTIVPALERMREILRHRHKRGQSTREAVRKAHQDQLQNPGIPLPPR